jgi:hypothetical protein
VQADVSNMAEIEALYVYSFFFFFLFFPLFSPYIFISSPLVSYVTGTRLVPLADLLVS